MEVTYQELLDRISAEKGLVETIQGVLMGAYAAQEAALLRDRSLLYGPDDPRVTVPDIVSGMEDGDPMTIPAGLGLSVRLETEMRTALDCWAFAPAYRPLHSLLENEMDDFSDEDIRRVLRAFIPHTVRVATVVWYDGYVLMRLKESGTVSKPASVIRFPQKGLIGHDDSLESAALEVAKSAFQPFIKPQWDVELMSTWTVLTPDRPEILLVRHAEFKGDPKQFYGTWAEEQYYPYMWAHPEAVSEAAEGDAAQLVRGVRIADKEYRACGRDLITEIVIDESCKFCGSTLKSSSRKVPIKSSLTVSDRLALDDVSRDIVLTFTAASPAIAM